MSTEVPSRTPTREQIKKETREALIAAGAAEFAENGIDAPSLDAICARAGFSRGAFYVHFADRDELLAAVVERVLTNFRQVVAGADRADNDFQQTMGRYVAAVIAGNPAISGVGKWHFHNTLMACTRSKKIRQSYIALQQQSMNTTADAVRRGQKKGELRGDVNADAIGEILVILSLGIGVMKDVGMPFDLLAGSRALATLMAAEPQRARRVTAPVSSSISTSAASSRKRP